MAWRFFLRRRYTTSMTGTRWIRNCVLTLAYVCPLWLAGQSANDDAEAKYANAGQQALAAGQYAEAQQNFEQLAKLEPGIAEVHATLAIIYYKQRQYEAAVREIRTAQKLKPGLPKLDSLMGMSLAELGRFKEALPGLEKGFKQTADTEIRRMCGLQLLRVYTGLQRDPDAVATALTLDRLYPDDPEILYHTARIYGNFTYLMMEELHDKAPDSIWMMQAQGEAYESQKDYESAIQAFQRVLKLEPKRPGIHYRIGRVYLRRFQDSHEAKDREAAVGEFQQELSVDQLNGNAAYELAQIDYDLGNLEQARQKFEALLAQRPEFEQAQVGLAGVLLESQKPELSIAHLKHAIELEPDDEVAWYRLARAYRVTGDIDGQRKALAEYQRLHGLKSSQRVRRTRQEVGQGIVSETGDVTPQHIEPATQP
jgi:predicted Zn-dependent protease